MGSELTGSHYKDESNFSTVKNSQVIYRILFVIRDDVVYVLHVRHDRQSPLTAEDWDNQA